MTPRFLGNFRFRNLVAIFTLAASFAPGAFAASVGPNGYTNDFSVQPPTTDWSTYAPPGANTTYGSIADIDAAVAALSASTVNVDLVADAVNPPAATGPATYCSSGFFLQTRPTGVAGTMLMCTLVNNIGAPANGVTLSYDFAKAAVLAEEIDGHRAYYSLSGAPGSWVSIPEFSSAAPGRLTAILNVSWPSGGSLYVLWVDDNAVASSPDTAMQIDNFSAKATPASQTPVAITSQPQNQTVQEGTSASFTVGASGNPLPTFQWWRENSFIGAATNATYTLAHPTLSDSGSHFFVVAANTVSNVNYAVTSSVVTLTVNADTNPPVAGYDPPPGSILISLSAINVTFNKTVTGVDASDLLIDGVPASSVITNNPNDFTFHFPQPPTGTVQVAWAANTGITDTGVLMNHFAGGSWTYTLDTNLANNSLIIISEFEADNATGIKDEDGNHSDWIELLNIGLLQGPLDGWFLTDTPSNLTKWQFPAGMPPLQPNNYLVVFASAKNRTNPLQPLHTNFKLSSTAGGYLALVNAQTNIVSVFTSYPAQSADVSYGRDFVDPNLVGYFATPTPGKQNSTRGSGFAVDPVFSYDSGVYTNDTLSVSITAPGADPGSTIYYSLDANVLPTTNSILYTGPITVGTNVIIKARVFPPSGGNLFPSDVLVRHYLFVDSTVKDFNSNIPVMIVSSPGKTIPQGILPGGIRPEGMLFVFDTLHGRSSLHNTPDLIAGSGLELFGQTSVGFPKPPVRIETHDAYINDLNVSILGIPPGNDFKWRNPYDDKSYLNDYLGYELWEKMGHYSCRRRLVECFANNSGRLSYPRDYIGIEVLFETIGIDKDRVDVPKLTPYDTNYSTIRAKGYIFKKDKDSNGDLNFSTSGGNAGPAGTFPAEALKLHEPKPQSLRIVPATAITTFPGPNYTTAGTNQMTYLQGFLGQLEKALYATNWLSLTGTNHYLNYLDADAAVDFALLIEFTKQIDGIRLSDYFTKTPGFTNSAGQWVEGKVQFGPCWDWNLSFGNANYLRCGGTDTWYFAEQDEGITANEDIWLRRLLNGYANMGAGNTLGPGGDPDFDQKFVDRWSVLRTNIFNATNVIAEIEELSTVLTEAATRDAWGASGKYRSGIVGVYEWPNPDGAQGGTPNSYYTFSGGVATRVNRNWDIDFQHPLFYKTADTNVSIIGQMKKWVLGRYLWIDSQFTPQASINAADGMVANGSTVAITAPAGASLYYTLDGSDPRAAGGGVAPGALTSPGSTNLTINGNVHLVVRAKTPTNGFYNTWSAPTAVSLFTAIPPLRITEIMYHPLPPPPGNTNSTEDFEYIEVKNIGSTPLNVNRFSLGGGVQFNFPNVVLAAGQRAVVVANVAAFQSRYGSGITILGTYTGHLNNAGDHLVLSGSVQETILDFDYDDKWYPITDGLGFSLVTVDENAATSAWGSASNWRVSSAVNGSPGQEEPAIPPRPAVVINEALTHEVPTAMDAIELLNTTGSPADISNWYLTDDFNTPQKYRIPLGTIIPAHGFIVFYETNSFGTNAYGPNGFGLAANGDQVYIFSSDGVNLTGYEHGFAFGAQANGVTFGRYIISTGDDHFVAQVASTLGGVNAGPLVGPVVTTTINYHPLDINTNGVSFNDLADEYIILKNITGSPAPLYDVAYPTNAWHLRGDVSYDFPTGVTIPAGGTLVLVNFDPAANSAATASFRSRNLIGGSVPMYGPWQGDLDNKGGNVELHKPDVPTTNDVAYILVDKVNYNDKAPWPAAADGFGLALQRVVNSSYGNDPTNWTAVIPSNFAPGGTAPYFTNAPVSHTVPTSSDVFVSAGATGTPPLSYQWRFAGANIAGATNSVLSVPNFQFSQAGVYDILVYNNSGSAVSSFVLNTRVGLHITTPPVNVFPTNGVNTNVNFSIAAVGTGLLRYQWRFGGNNILGATNAILLITNVQPANEGTYDCVVTDDFDMTVSPPVTLTIISKPTFIQHPLSQTAVSNQTVTFSVAVSVTAPHTPPASFRWRKSGLTLVNGAFNGYIFTAPLYSTLTITNVQPTNAATYTVIVTNLAGTALGGPLPPGVSSNAVLTVLADSDGDGLPDNYQTNFVLHPCFTNNLATDGFRDDDGDGMNNAAEYAAGTDPCDPNSNLRAALVGSGSGTVQFTAVSLRTYTVQYTDDINAGQWNRLADVVASSTNRTAAVVDPNPRTNRLYRIITPVQP